MTSETLVLLGDIEAAALTIGGILFLIMYSVLAKWWKFREGWFISLASLWLTVLFGYIAASRFNLLPPLDDSATRIWLRLIIFTGFGVALVWVSVLLLLAQYEQRKRRLESEES